MFKKELPGLDAIGNESPAANVNPEFCRVFNRTSAKVAALLSALGAITSASNLSCGGSANTVEYIYIESDAGTSASDSGTDAPMPDSQPPVDPGCDPMPSCPELGLLGGPDPDSGRDFYLNSNRFFRVDPSTNEIIKVCEPIERTFCKEGQTPEKDGCNLPVCKSAKACDPVPANKKNSLYPRTPEYANYPTTSFDVMPWSDPFMYSRGPVLYPVIYDILPDCEPGFNPPAGATYMPCDLIPTCEKTIPYCDPLPRCQPGESPIKCEAGSGNFSKKEDCVKVLGNIEYIFDDYHLAINPMVVGENEFCPAVFDPSINETVYRPPVVTVKCLPIPECADNEIPKPITLSVPMECGQWGKWTSVMDYVPSCDPIKSCKK